MSVRRLILVIAAGLLVLVCGAGPAQASTGFGFSFAFGSPEGFNGPKGVALDQATGDVYVTDQGNNRVDKFNASGEIQKAFGTEGHVEMPGAAPDQLTVDNYAGPDQGDIFVAGSANGVVYKVNGAGTQVTEVVSGLPFPTGVAVDSAGDFFVSLYLEGSVLEFNSNWEPINAAGAIVDFGENTVISGLEPLGEAYPQTVAVSSDGNDLYVATASGAMKYTLSLGVYTKTPKPFDPIPSEGVTISPSGNVFVEELLSFRSDEIAEYEPSGAILASFGGTVLGEEGPSGIAVSNSNLYVAEGRRNTVYAFVAGPSPEVPVTGPQPNAATEVTHTTATLHGILNPHTSTKIHWHFVYNTDGTCTAGSTKEAPDPREVENEQSEVEGTGVEESRKVTGLVAGTTYTFCVAATNNNGSIYGAPVTFTTEGSPNVLGETVSSAGAKGTTLTAQIEPEGFATTYYFEYGTTSSYGSLTPEANVSMTEGVVTVSSRLEGFPPATKYHFRIVATNKDGTERGADTRFSTLPPVLNGLPDGRAYEMVTPVENEDAEVYIPLDGTSGVLGYGQGVSIDAEFQSSADGNSVTYFGDPTKGGTGSGGLGEGNSYLATRSPGGGWTQVNASNPDASLQSPPLFTVTPPNRPAEFFHSTIAGSSTDGSRVFFEADDDLLPGDGVLEKELAADVESEAKHNEYHNNLYESVQGHLNLVDVLPDGKVAGNVIFGALPFGEPSRNSPDVSDVVSSSGSRVFWTDIKTGSLYVRENSGQPESPSGPQGECTVATDACTVQVDASQAHGPGGGGRFWTASKDGSEVFFTDSDAAGLTSSTLPGSGTNLYEYDVNPMVGQPGVLNDLTPVAEAGVEGVIGTSENGEYIYFVATGVLNNSENNEHDMAAKGGYNLYVIHDDMPPRFIATLSRQDGSLVKPFQLVTGGLAEFGDWQPGLGHRTAEVSPNGQGLVFMSEESLTGYPNLVRGEKLDEVFVYEAGSAHLFCVSCNPSGEPPRPNVEAMVGIGGFVQVAWGNGGLRWMSGNGGRVFFDSSQPLVAQDTNEAQDVYEWELDGIGSCTQLEGCIYLLSGGTSLSAVWLEGESSSGDDVFIASRAQLTPQDHSETYNLFDARVDGVQPVSEPVCSGTGCQGVPSPPPTFATPPSVTFEGVGNFTSTTLSSRPKTDKKKTTVKCSKNKKLSHGKCVKRKTKKKGVGTGKVKSKKGGN